MARLAIALALVLALAALADARSCRNPNTCRNDGECITPKSGKGFECLCAAGFVGERCEYGKPPEPAGRVESQGRPWGQVWIATRLCATLPWRLGLGRGAETPHDLGAGPSGSGVRTQPDAASRVARAPLGHLFLFFLSLSPSPFCLPFHSHIPLPPSPPPPPAETPQNWQEFGECTYLVVTAPQLEYADAADACERSGGYLAFIGDDGLNEFLGNALEPAEENKIARWIGLRRDKNNKLSWRSPANTWDDIDSYSAWEPGYPGVNTEDACVFQDTRGGEVEWLVDTCKEKRRYICQRCPTDSDDGKRRRRRNRRRRRRNRRRN